MSSRCCTFGQITFDKFPGVACPDRAEVKAEAIDPEGIWPEAMTGEMCMRHGKLIESRAPELSRGKVDIKLKPIRYRDKKTNGESD
jgi:hypothetical protein